jgi:hypothetical protein
VQISELILRAQVLTADDVTPEIITAPTPHETGGSRHWDDRRDDRDGRGDRYERREGYDHGRESYDRRGSEAPAEAAPPAPAPAAAAPEAPEANKE